MSVAEVHVKPIFGPITVEDMAGNEKLTRHVMSVVAEACKHTKGRYNAASVAEGLVGGKMKLWGVLTPPAELEAAVVTKIESGVLEVVIAGPSIHDILPFLDVLKRYAKSNGCTAATITGPEWFAHHLGKGWFTREVRFETKLA